MYRPDVYFLSRNIVQTPIFTFYAILYTSIYYFFIGFTPGLDRFFTCLLVAVLLTWCSMSFGERRRVMYLDLCVLGGTGMVIKELSEGLSSS